MMPLSPTRCGHQPHEIAPLLTLRAVRRALATLSTTHREVIELAYFRDLSQSQIADRLHLPRGTVKTRTFHALRSLKAALADLDPDRPPRAPARHRLNAHSP